jgi:hypothetical protein
MDVTRFREAAKSEREVRVVVASDGEERRTPIWIVTSGDSVFVRSYRATAGEWYQHVTAQPSFPLEISGEVVNVKHERVEDGDTLAAVDRAYMSKYPTDAETPDMLTPAVAQTTLRLEPLPS